MGPERATSRARLHSVGRTGAGCPRCMVRVRAALRILFPFLKAQRSLSLINRDMLRSRAMARMALPERAGALSSKFGKDVEGTVNVDPEKLEVFMGKMIGHMTGSTLCYSIWLGDELGLYRE